MSKHLSTPWHYNRLGQMIFGEDDFGDEVLIAQVRGWGHLTGRGAGALGLSHEEAAAIQDQRGRLLAAAPQLAAALREIMEADMMEGITLHGAIQFSANLKKIAGEALLKLEAGL